MSEKINELINEIFKRIYPIGSIYVSNNNTNPSTLFGGNWIQIKDTFLLGAGDTYSNGATGGEATHTLTFSEMPSHNHSSTGYNWGWGWSDATESVQKSVQGGYWGSNALTTTSNRYETSSTGGSNGTTQPHNNMPPYLAVYVWKRVPDITYNSIVLSSTKSILSYVGGEKTTLTAQLMNGQVADTTSGVNITFKQGSTLLGTAQTDNTGLATLTNGYTSTGAGDVTITAECGSLTQTHSIEDCIFYSTSESTCTNNSYITIADLSNITLPSKFILSMDYKTNGETRCGLFSKNNFSGNPNYSIFIGSPNGSSSWYYGGRSTSTQVTDVSGSPTSYTTYTIVRNGNTFQYNRTGSSTYSKSFTWFNNYSYVIGMMGWGTNKQSYAKNIKLKKL